VQVYSTRNQVRRESAADLDIELGHFYPDAVLARPSADGDQNSETQLLPPEQDPSSQIKAPEGPALQDAASQDPTTQNPPAPAAEHPESRDSDSISIDSYHYSVNIVKRDFEQRKHSEDVEEEQLFGREALPVLFTVLLRSLETLLLNLVRS
jgi:hypothetical protein